MTRVRGAAAGAVAVVGVGDMGGRVARRLLERGYDVSVWNRTPERASPLADLGARTTETPAAAAAEADVVVTMVADPDALRDVSEGSSGIAAGLRRDALVVEMSTVGPGAVGRLASALPDAVALIDAPVFGSIGEAETGTLTILVGGDPDVVGRARPLLANLGTVLHVGPLGAGAAAKLVANLALFGTLGVLGEAVALANGLGLSRDAAYEVLRHTPLGPQSERRRTSIEGDVYPRRFALGLARKDADLIIEAAAAAGLDLRLGAAARAWFVDAEAGGAGDRDYSAVLARIIGDRSARGPAEPRDGRRP